MKTLYYLVFAAAGVLAASCSADEQSPLPQTKETLQAQLQEIIGQYDATVGVSIVALEDNDALTLNNGHHFPMQSTFKFPLALAVLKLVDQQKLSLEQKVHVTKDMLRPNTWCPMLDKYPNGGDVTVAELLDYSASQSDNNACDILFDLVGGTAKTEAFIHGTGVTDIAIKATETEMATGWDVQYTNWVTPAAMTQLLGRFYGEQDLTKKSNDFLMKLMADSPTSKQRLKGMLPEHTVVAHKTGTSDTNEDGLIGAVNDIGIITLPNGKHLAIAVFVSDTKESYETAELIIARIARAAWDYYTGKQTTALRKVELLDESRNRSIPLAIYENLAANNHKVVILSGGYLSEYDRYSYIANKLADKGYLVVSIQHDLPGDAPMAQEGDIYALREPIWRRGDSTILYTVSELKKQYRKRTFNELILIGHSNGGDMSLLLGKDYPQLISKIITLDHRRMPMPKGRYPSMLSLRAGDFKADPGVLPTKEEQQSYNIRIVELGKDVKHGEMDDSGSRVVKERILEAIEGFLE
jgi:beta-lactamase class A